MGKLIVYNFETLNGFFKGPNEGISWAKGDSKGEADFTAENLRSENILLFGRVTYDLITNKSSVPQA